MSVINIKEQLVHSLHWGCVQSTMICELISELEKHDSEAVKRIIAHAEAHRERHKGELNEHQPKD